MVDHGQLGRGGISRRAGGVLDGISGGVGRGDPLYQGTDWPGM